MALLGRLAARLGHRTWFGAIGSRVLPTLDRTAHRVSGGRWMVASLAFPTLLLHCGPGKPVPLLYARDDDGLLIAATNWGKPEHPRWSTRLLTGCPAFVETRGVASAVAVLPLSVAQVEMVWPKLLEVWPAFETYRRRAQRQIRVFRLTPI